MWQEAFAPRLIEAGLLTQAEVERGGLAQVEIDALTAINPSSERRKRTTLTLRPRSFDRHSSIAHVENHIFVWSPALGEQAIEARNAGSRRFPQYSIKLVD